MGPSLFSTAALRSQGFPYCKSQENYRATANRFQNKHPVIGYDKISIQPGCCEQKNIVNSFKLSKNPNGKWSIHYNSKKFPDVDGHQVQPLIDQIEFFVSRLSNEIPFPSEKHIKKGEKRQFTCWTDGACSGNPGPGGWAFVITDRDGNVIIERSGFSEATTSNRMEMTAIIETLTFIPNGSQVHIKTDSRLVANTYNKGWRRNKNLDLWKRFDDAIKRHKLVIIEWVKGHNKIKFNERADHLATTAIRAGITHSYEKNL